MATADTRRRILDAALQCFVEEGYERTTIARIREQCDTSNGALFHHFQSKEAIADAIYLEAIGSFQAGMWTLVRSRPQSLRAAVRATIAHQLRWTEQHADLARFVYMRGHLDWNTPAGSEVAALNRELADAIKEWMTPLVRAGEMRSASMLLISAIVSGPAHAIARRWLAGQLECRPTELVDELADAAWAGLRGRPSPARGSARPEAAADFSHVTVELVSADGNVLARGRATAELVRGDREIPIQ
jgi:AcrR family transcriptional regulator